MSNHGPNPFEDFNDPDKSKSQNQNERIRQLLDTTGFVGALGQPPKKYLTKDDEGPIQFAIGEKDGKVIVDFGNSVAWLGMEPQQAADFASALLKRAREVGRKQGQTITLTIGS